MTGYARKAGYALTADGVEVTYKDADNTDKTVEVQGLTPKRPTPTPLQCPLALSTVSAAFEEVKEV